MNKIIIYFCQILLLVIGGLLIFFQVMSGNFTFNYFWILTTIYISITIIILFKFHRIGVSMTGGLFLLGYINTYHLCTFGEKLWYHTNNC